MKMKSSHAALILLGFVVFNLSFFPAVYAQSQPYNIPQNTYVSNTLEFESVVNTATQNLQTPLVICGPYSTLEKYTATLDQLIGISRYEITLSHKFNGTNIVTINFTYKQAYKICQYIKNPSLYSRLSSSDINLYQLAQSIVSKITTPNMSDYEKELAIHDYIVDTTTYDYDGLTKGTLPDSVYTAYGVLVNKKAVCQGYSEAMKLLLNLVGIECEIVTGSSNTYASHAWNIVKLGDSWYMVDVTYDDPVSYNNGERLSLLSHDYFNVDQATLSKDHNWDYSKWPTASGTQYNYYNVNGTIFNTYEEFKAYIISAIKAGKRKIVCYLNNYDAKSYDLNFIFNYYHGDINYSAPKSSSGSITIYLN